MVYGDGNAVEIILLDALHAAAVGSHDLRPLLGQNVNAFGRDGHGDGLSFARLLQQVQEHGPSAWDCPQGPVWVYTHHEYPGISGADVMFLRGPVGEFAEDIADSSDGRDVWLRGADLAGQYLQEGLLDELRLTLHPVLLGAGGALLPAAVARQARLLTCEPAADGSLRLCYSFRA